VTACNSDGTWNETVATVELTVEPYWWETVWFQVGGSLSAFGLLGGVVVFWLRRRYRHQLERLEQQQATEKERMRIARDLHDDLGAGLTQISLVTALTQEGAPDAERAAASSKVNELALDLVRSLDEIVWAVRPQNDNLPSLVEYLANAGRGLCEGSDVRCWVSGLPTVPELEVCASVRHNLLMAFREAVNNVLKHAGATELRIRLYLEADEFTVEIADNGCGFEVAKGEAKCSGLLHIRQRLTELGGRCEMTSVIGQGTTVRLSFPLTLAARSVQESRAH
jgi:signal transduction histidine kinase